MASKLTKDVVATLMPRMEVVESQSVQKPVTDAANASISPGPSIDDLKRKFLGTTSDDSTDSKVTLENVDDEDLVEVVRVRPKRAPADPVDDPGPRTVIVSQGGRGVIGSQG